mmetsp:Transcript_3444/g.6866  ORF Transcript_3444/g.6866 Transcript_3444/m.6866 type:complete len:202 (-) Transcript_3444:240-845(-)|eukprot:CAMPEP_0173383740 /NCGR_PEP_ID=MMETSP1356-20130122/6313_1 /TAXON_ID=77927 ORGANISM="Hemiselmis virescens, Strain PCC157" /NCGR_SAMPLE_ID=MMETSP1356 /ASSEMBLY_ACC=CAM_ASM_000847 /LENGTH=201 /DNA_ID=CAMNT_0014338759 /DNA_START=187 /DNA_END=792 /DNA_ORIENTATION=-
MAMLPPCMADRDGIVDLAQLDAYLADHEAPEHGDMWKYIFRVVIRVLGVPDEFLNLPTPSKCTAEDCVNALKATIENVPANGIGDLPRLWRSAAGPGASDEEHPWQGFYDSNSLEEGQIGMGPTRPHVRRITPALVASVDLIVWSCCCGSNVPLIKLASDRGWFANRVQYYQRPKVWRWFMEGFMQIPWSELQVGVFDKTL